MFPNKSTLQVSPNLLANFDPNAVLEPQKSGIGRLIDIEGTTTNLVTSPSFLDQKPHYDLIDVFQNIYVAPLQVKLKNPGSDISNQNPNYEKKCDPFEINSHENGPRVETLIDLGVTNEPPSTYDSIDFKIFCDKIEAGEKVDWTKDTKEKIVTQTDLDKSDQIGSIQEVDEDEMDPERLIDEVLRQKTIEKHLLEDMASDTDKNSPQPKKNNTEIVDLTKVKVLSSPVDLEALKNNKSDNKLRNETTSCSYHATPEIPSFKLNNNFINDCNSLKNYSNLKIDGQIENSVQYKVIPIKKDEKIYRKKRIMKPEYQTRNFTKGPDLEEKMIVLPQIMSRILSRKADIEKRKCLKRVLILDDRKTDSIKSNYEISQTSEVLNSTKSNIYKFDEISKGNDSKQCCSCTCSSKSVQIPEPVNSPDAPIGELNPIIVMEDCRKERMRAIRKNQEFHKFVVGEQRDN